MTPDRKAQERDKKDKEKRAFAAEGRRWLQKWAGQRLQWDTSWQHALARHAQDPAQYEQGLGHGVADSPYAAFLFVEYEGAAPRQALLAYTLAKVRGDFFSDAHGAAQ